MSTAIEIRSEAIDNDGYRFSVNRPVHTMPAGAYRFTSPADARGIPVAEAVLAVPGVREVILGDQYVAAHKAPEAEWCDLEEPVHYAITAAVEGLDQPKPSSGPVAAVDDDAMFDIVAEIFERDINPSVARHGGAVELIDVQEGTVVLRMMGGCQGCGMANVTLRQGIEATLQRALPAIKGIEDITDHASGTDPYFASQKQ